MSFNDTSPEGYCSSIFISPTPSQSWRPFPFFTKVALDDVHTLVARRLKSKRLNSVISDVKTRLNKGGENCMEGYMLEVQEKNALEPENITSQ